REQGCRQGRRRGDEAGVARGEDRVLAILAVEGEAAIASLEEADGVLVAEVPAAVALAQVAAECRHVADLRPGDLAGSVGQCREETTKLLMGGDGGQLDAGADRHGPVLYLNRIETADAAKADDAARLGNVLLLQVEEI